MSHKFNPEKCAKLDSPERRKLLPPEETLVKLGPWEDQIVGDIGCGIGYFSLPLTLMVGEKGYVYGFDISPQMIEEVRRRAEDEKILNFECSVSKENSLPLADDRLDTVFLAAVVHELSDAKSFFKEAQRVLKPGGQVKIVEWKKENTPQGPPLDHRIGSEELKQMLDENGFMVKTITDLGSGHYGIIATEAFPQ